nr:hypothetical protein CFP56_53051 [Quercus suber]
MPLKIATKPSSKVSASSGINWEIIFSFGIWSLWLRRNNIIFRNENYQRNLKAKVLSKAIEFAFIGVRGLIRNDKGEWIKGYARAIGLTTSVAAELWASGDGIKLCISLKIPAVITDLDAQLVVDLLEKNDGHPNGIGALVSDCKAGLREIPMLQI